MPYSSFIFDKEISGIIRTLNPNVFLDIGAGAGKYGEIVRNISIKTKTIAIEIEKDYIDKFSLNEKYDLVWCMSVMDIIQPIYFDKTFDVIMIGDIIEHLKKSDGVDLLNFLIYRTKWIIIEFPYHYLQNAVEGYYSEAHISVWGKQDFEVFESTKLYKKDDQRLIILKGYLADNNSIDTIESFINQYEGK